MTVDAELSGPRLAYRSAAEITPTRPTWLWAWWLVAAALHLLVGRQGSGKSTFAANVIATLTTGRQFPGDESIRDPLTCAWLTKEEPAEIVVGRLHAAGADVGRVLILGEVEDLDDEGRTYRRPWLLPKDGPVLERLIREHEVAALVVDGIGYSVVGDSHNYNVVGQATSALTGVAERTGCTILGLTHPPKGTSDPVTAAIGSTAWTAVARIVWVLGIDPEDDTQGRRVVRVSKSNFKMPSDGLAFAIGEDEEFECGFVTGLCSSNVSAEALMAATMDSEQRTERHEAREFVLMTLERGPLSTAEFTGLARAAGLSERTVERARRDLGVKAELRRDNRTGKVLGWSLSLPKATPPIPTPPPTLPWRSGGVGGVDSTSIDGPQAAQGTTPPREGVGSFDMDEFLWSASSSCYRRFLTPLRLSSRKLCTLGTKPLWRAFVPTAEPSDQNGTDR